ncbi:MAG TPA: hypothetical protein VEB22_13595 [Phycisphaerales bacterium]|nr:hypothetical protein [Phycisphaerales bacterium]
MTKSDFSNATGLWLARVDSPKLAGCQSAHFDEVAKTKGGNRDYLRWLSSISGKTFWDRPSGNLVLVGWPLKDADAPIEAPPSSWSDVFKRTTDEPPSIYVTAKSVPLVRCPVGSFVGQTDLGLLAPLRGSCLVFYESRKCKKLGESGWEWRNMLHIGSPDGRWTKQLVPRSGR